MGQAELNQQHLHAALGDEWSLEQINAAVEMLASSGGKFPAGVRRLPSELIAAIQRERLVLAMLSAASDLGYRSTNVQDVLDRARVSRPTFYIHFKNKEHCFLTAFDTAAERLGKRLDTAVAAAGEDWRDQLRAGLGALLGFVSAEPDAAYTLIVEARAAVPAALLRRDGVLDRLALCIDSKAREGLSDPPAAIAAAGIVGGIDAVLYIRLTRGETEDLDSLLPSLMYFAVLPFAGEENAARELKGLAPA